MKLAQLLLLSSLLLPISTQESVIHGSWKLRSYDAIDNIKNSPAYLFGDEKAVEMIDQQFETILAKGEYNFGADTLNYTDLEGTVLVYRRALWKIDGYYLKIKEIDRDYEREAYIRILKPDSLVLSPVIDGEVVESEMVFTRERD